MGYSANELRIYLRLDSHGGSEQERDQQAAEALKEEIAGLILSKQDYARIAILGVEGGA